MSSPLVVCLGDVMVDITATLPGPLQIGSDTPAPVSWHGGGSAANTACWLATAGASAVLLGRVGDDVAGRWSLDALAQAGVRCAVEIDPELPTGTCLVLVDRSGERTMIPSAAANGAITIADIDAADVFTAGAHLHVSGYSLFGTSRAAAEHALLRARQAGMTVSIGAASAAPLRSAGVDAFLQWVGPDALLFANADEAAVLCGDTEPQHAARELGAAVGEAVVTVGASGAIWSDGGEVQRIASSPVAVVDSTGAGDAFAAGFLAARRSGASPADALAAGNDLAARACHVHGARPPTDP